MRTIRRDRVKAWSHIIADTATECLKLCRGKALRERNLLDVLFQPVHKPHKCNTVLDMCDLLPGDLRRILHCLHHLCRAYSIDDLGILWHGIDKLVIRHMHVHHHTASRRYSGKIIIDLIILPQQHTVPCKLLTKPCTESTLVCKKDPL